jgi:hypothetical protein
MTGREKPKRKALHRGLDDIVNRDASLTSKLLGRVKPPAREPLELSTANDVAQTTEPAEARPEHEAVKPRSHGEAATIHRLDSSRAQAVRPEREAVSQASPAAILSFSEFVLRWGFVLRSGGRAGKLRICEVLYNHTYAVGRETYFTSYEKLAKLAKLEKKQCAINVKQLESLGFIERLNIYNTATRQGTEFKLHLDQLPPQARRSPRHHYYDEDLPHNS